MKKFIILVLLILSAAIEIKSQSISFKNGFVISDSATDNGAINFLRVGGQLLGGTAGGLILAFPLRFVHPFAAIAGWYAGTSLGVYVIGNIGDTKGAYWLTLLGGAFGSTLYLLSFKYLIRESEVYIGTFLIAVPFEIFFYYFFKPDFNNLPDRNNAYTILFKNEILKRNIFSPSYLSFNLIHISF
jgi:hypothetical protein